MESAEELHKGTLGKGIVFDIKDKIIEAKSERKKETKIFIGSSKEAEAEMERIGVMIEKLNCDVITWQDEESFISGDFTLESLINMSKQVDAAIFVFNGEDETRQHIIISFLEFDCIGARVGEITKKTNLSRPAVSHHIRILKEAGIIGMRREGTKNYYYIDPKKQNGIN